MCPPWSVITSSRQRHWPSAAQIVKFHVVKLTILLYSCLHYFRPTLHTEIIYSTTSGNIAKNLSHALTALVQTQCFYGTFPGIAGRAGTKNMISAASQPDPYRLSCSSAGIPHSHWATHFTRLSMMTVGFLEVHAGFFQPHGHKQGDVGVLG